jgi:hypothetical protein
MTTKMALRALKRRLTNTVYHAMIDDAGARPRTAKRK